MALPEPKPGLVIRYAYLWRDEADRGRDESVKDRPCVVVLAVERADGLTHVRVAPITHTPPRASTDAVEIPVGTKRRLGLDDARSWINACETNLFTWPGPDIRPVDWQSNEFAYGLLAGDTFRKLRDAMISNIEKNRSSTVQRSR